MELPDRMCLAADSSNATSTRSVNLGDVAVPVRCSVFTAGADRRVDAQPGGQIPSPADW